MTRSGRGEGDGDGVGAGDGLCPIACNGSLETASPAAPKAGKSFTKDRRSMPKAFLCARLTALATRCGFSIIVLTENFDACNRMNLIPTIVTVGDVGAGYAYTIAEIGNRDLWMKSTAGGFISGICRRVLTDYLHY